MFKAYSVNSEVFIIKIYGTISGEGHIRKKYFENEKKFYINDRYDFSIINVDDYPLMTDFELIARKGNPDFLGKHLYYYSKERGILSSFPWWDNVDKQIVNYSQEDIPLGTFNKPYNDCEQGWQIIIFNKKNHVYILQGDEPACTKFNAWYKVRIEDYLENWNKLIKYPKENVEG